MGTKIECAIDPLASALTNTSNGFTVHGVDDWQYNFQTRDHHLKKKKKLVQGRSSRNRLEIDFRYSMDRPVEKHNIESIRRTMQIHEDIFKHQVKELHRLYSVQKTLMGELKKELKQKQIWSSNHSHRLITKQNHATTTTTTTQTSSGYVFNFQNVSEDPSSRERSGSCSGETIRVLTPRGFDLETPAAVMEEGAADAVPSNIIMSMQEQDGSDEDSQVELTLSIGVSPSSSNKIIKRSSNCGELDFDSPAASDRGNHNQDFSGPNTPMSSSSATFDQEKKMPHWLLGLSINRS